MDQVRRWTTSADVRAKVQREWDNGQLLASSAEAPAFPWRIPLSGPKPRDVTDRYGEVQAWIADVTGESRPNRAAGYDLGWRGLGARTSGANQIPAAAVLQSPEHAIAFLGLESELAQWQDLLARTRSALPELLPWLADHALQALRHAPEWERFLRIAEWLRAHPCPGIYLRQLDLPGIDTKFIERHEAVLKPLLTAVLDGSAYRKDEADFSRRFGFTVKPWQVRLRFLDPRRSLGGLTLLSAPFEQLCRIDPGVSRVVITENEINGFSFPDLPDALVLFGLGYAVERLAGIPWLHRCPVWYWGDIDTDGFVMLDRIRGVVPHVRSFLMDEATVLSQRTRWGRDPRPTHQPLNRLTVEESLVWHGLVTDRWSPSLRIEQEHIPFGLVRAALPALLSE